MLVLDNSPITDQEHRVSLNGKVETVRLGELFEDFPGVEQIIRFRRDIYEICSGKLKKGEVVDLFNLPDNVNTGLIEKFSYGESSKGLIAEIHGPEGIIALNSLRVVNVLEMSEVGEVEVQKRELFRGSLCDAQSIDELVSWLGGTFYSGIDLSDQEMYLHRRITI